MLGIIRPSIERKNHNIMRRIRNSSTLKSQIFAFLSDSILQNQVTVRLRTNLDRTETEHKHESEQVTLKLLKLK